MADEFEAVGTAIEGGLIATAIEGSGNNATSGDPGICLNCGATVAVNFCSSCGQSLHARRSIAVLWHDILHGVFHFEGKFWRTLPLLAWKPGDLTRRYVHGERAKFISPMALFLFSVFMMFAVFSFLGDPFSNDDISLADDAVGTGIVSQTEEIEDQIREKTGQLDEATGDTRLQLEREILDLKKGRNMLASLTRNEPPYPDVHLADGDAEVGNLSAEDLEQIESGLRDIQEGKALTDGSLISTGSSTNDEWLRGVLQKITANPDLLIYKLKANGYKFAWLLIPISLPFVWLSLIGRRGFHFYDHAVFTTYSISFMSLLFITCAILAAVGVSESVWASLAMFYPPVHMYRQLRHAYGLSRIEALFRSAALIAFTFISALIFFMILLALGVLG